MKYGKYFIGLPSYDGKGGGYGISYDWCGSALSSSNKIFVMGTPYQSASTSSSGRYGKAKAWLITSILASSTYTKGSDTNTYVTSSNPLAYPNNGYQGGYWYVMVEE